MSQEMGLCYNIAVEGNGYQELVNWGETLGWQKILSDQLESAQRISLIPKTSNGLPVVTVELGEDKRWVVFSRVVGRLGGKRIRLYCIGWQMTVGTKNIKSLQWVYPNGVIENADEPSYADLMLEE